MAKETPIILDSVYYAQTIGHYLIMYVFGLSNQPAITQSSLKKKKYTPQKLF